MIGIKVEKDIIPIEEAKLNARYFRTLYQMSIFYEDSEISIANRLGMNIKQINNDINRIKRTLHSDYPIPINFILAIDGFKGLELKLKEK